MTHPHPIQCFLPNVGFYKRECRPPVFAHDGKGVGACVYWLQGVGYAHFFNGVSCCATVHTSWFSVDCSVYFGCSHGVFSSFGVRCALTASMSAVCVVSLRWRALTMLSSMVLWVARWMMVTGCVCPCLLRRALVCS